MILVTGGTGKTGGETIRHLVELGVKVRTISRSTSNLDHFDHSQVEVIQGDLSDKKILETCLAGIEKVFLTLPNGPNQLDLELGFINAVSLSNVSHLVYLSSTESNPDNNRKIPQVHVAVADEIKKMDIGWTILRPNFFMQNIFMFCQSVKKNNTFTFPSQDGTAAMCDVRDIGKAASLVLTGKGHESKSYDLTGPEILNMNDLATLLSNKLGKNIEYIPQSLDDFRVQMSKVLKSGWHVDAVVELMQEMSEEGGLDFTTNTLEEIIGRRPLSLAEFIDEHLSMFKQDS